MRAAGVRARQELRSHWAAIAGLAVLIGLFGGVTMACVAGARRTATAYDRYLEQARPSDVLSSGYRPGTPEGEALLEQLRALPEVAEIAETAPMLAFLGEEIAVRDFEAPVDPGLLTAIDRPQILSGRTPDPARADEVFLNPAAAEAAGVAVGDDLTVHVLTDEEYLASPTDLDAGAERRLRVVGIGVLPNEIVPIAPADSSPAVVFSAAYLDAHPDEVADYSYLHIRLRGGTQDVEAFRQGFAELAVEAGFPPSSLTLIDNAERREKVNRAIRPQAQALAIFAALLGVVTFMILGQLLVRHLVQERAERRMLWVLGFTRAQLLWATAGRLLVMMAGAAMVATTMAVLLSYRFPIGPARLAEPDPGSSLDGDVLVAGSAVLILAFVVRGLVAVVRTLPSTAPDRGKRSADRVGIASAVARMGAPPTMTSGVQMAFERGAGAGAVPALGALVATVLAIGAVAAAVTFGLNLERLVSTPELYGLNWDLAVGGGFRALPLEASRRVLDGSPDVEAWSAANYGELTLRAEGGRELTAPAVGIDRHGSDVYVRLVRGRPVATADEIVLGTATAGDLDVDVGGWVTTPSPGAGPQRLRVVGIGVFPGLGRAIFASTDLAEGAAVRPRLLVDPILGGPGPGYTAFFVRLAPDADAGAVGRLQQAFRPVNPDCELPCVVTDEQPAGIRNYERVRTTPLVLAGLLGLLAVATLAHTLVTSVRHRRREFATLQSIGFVRRQVAATTAWQATSVALVALAVGLPIGVAGGRVLWSAFAAAIGVEVAPRTPTLALLLAVPAVIAVANLSAIVPAIAAARTRAATVLRSE